MVSRNSEFNLCNLETLMGGVQHSKATGSRASSFQFFSLKLLICVSLENILYCFLASGVYIAAD